MSDINKEIVNESTNNYDEKMDAVLQSYVDGYAESISPAREAVSKIITGMVLNVFTLNFLWLDYILPCIGTLLIFMGFRTLRTGNLSFKLCYGFSILNLITLTVKLLISVSPYVNQQFLYITLFGAAVNLLLLYFFGRGIQQAHLRTSGEKRTNPLIPVVIWQIVVIAMALYGYSGWLGIIILIAAYIFMIKYIVKSADALEKSGYDVPAAPVRVSGSAIFKGYIISMIILLVIGTWVFNRTPVSAYEDNDEAGSGLQTQEIRETLIDKGFPEDILAGIDDEDIEGLGDVKEVAMSDNFNSSEDPEKEKMIVTTIAVRTGDTEAKCFVYFQYQKKYRASLMDSATVYVDAHDVSHWANQGKIFYTKGGKAYTARVDFKENLKTLEMWFGPSESKYFTSKYSFPLFSKNQRGYFSYWAKNQWLNTQTGEQYFFGMCDANFNCQRKYLVLPYVELPYEPDGTISFGGGFGSRMGEYNAHTYFTYDTIPEE